MLLFSSIFVVFISLINLCNSANIFIISNLPSGSHAIWFGKLANLLAQRGHEVVMLGAGPYKQTPNSNVKFVLIEEAYRWISKFEEALRKESLVSVVSGKSTPSDNIEAASSWSLTECEHFLRSEGTKSVIKDYKDKKFDLIIVDFACESFLGFVHLFGNPPLILATPYTNAYNIHDAVGTYDNPSYVPFSFTPFKPDMDLKERAINLFYQLYGSYLWNFYNIPNENSIAKDVFGNDVPDVAEIMNNASLLFVGNDPVLTAAKPLPPAYIPVGGFHIDPIKPLPQDIKQFLDDSKNGVIYFSFGSNFKSIFMTPEMIATFLSAFKELPYKVIWKLEFNDTKGIPSNVLISKWLPQNDILAHPNVRCFISHGGLLSTQEAIHHGIPILGLPFMFDQIDVVNKLQENGVGLRMEFHKLTRDYIKENINKIMKKNYRDKMQEWSRIFRDTPQRPDERAIWWIEYVLRNPAEIRKYLRCSSMNLSWYQRLMLDVAALVLIPIALLYCIIYNLVNFIFKKLFRRNQSIHNKNKKTN